jgi:hypothetical protein
MQVSQVPLVSSSTSARNGAPDVDYLAEIDHCLQKIDVFHDLYHLLLIV